MKIAVVSDIHANYQAWQAVLDDIRRRQTDLIICLGDIVGYGPEPEAVLESVRANANYCLLGNHDAAICGKIGVEMFSDVAVRSLKWTRTRLDEKAVRYLSLLPLTLAARGFRCAHGEFSMPAQFNYVFEAHEAAPSWESVREQILFVGHTHQPGVFVIGRSRRPHHLKPQDFALEEGKRYLVNVGSVGQPRDGDVRSAYCLYDIGQASVYWRRVAFDLDAFRAASRRAGIPESEHRFLRHDPQAQALSARDLTSFRPSQRPEDGAQNVVLVRNIALLHRRVKYWRWVAGLFSAGCILALTLLGWIWWNKVRHPAIIENELPGVIQAVAWEKGANLLRFPQVFSGPNAPMDGWAIHLSDSKRQSVEFMRNINSEPLFVFCSEDAASEVAIVSAPIVVTREMKLTMNGLFKKSDDFKGFICLTAKLSRRSASGLDAQSAAVSARFVKEPNQYRKGGWLEAQQTFDVPAQADMLEIQIGGRFKGRVEVRGLSLIRKK